MYGAFQANTIHELTELLGLDVGALSQTVKSYNSGLDADGSKRFDPTRLDGLSTREIIPPKSNWAQPLDQPPFYGVPMHPGITFTYMGVGIDKQARIRRTSGTLFRNLFAAGEIMSGNILSTGYLAGFGMTIRTVWGRIAGQEAGRHAIG